MAGCREAEFKIGVLYTSTKLLRRFPVLTRLRGEVRGLAKRTQSLKRLRRPQSLQSCYLERLRRPGIYPRPRLHIRRVPPVSYPARLDTAQLALAQKLIATKSSASRVVLSEYGLHLPLTNDLAAGYSLASLTFSGAYAADPDGYEIEIWFE